MVALVKLGTCKVVTPSVHIRNVWTGGAFSAASLDAHISRFTAVRELLGLKHELLRAVAKEQRPTVHDAFMPLSATDNFVVRGHHPCMVPRCLHLASLDLAVVEPYILLWWYCMEPQHINCIVA